MALLVHGASVALPTSALDRLDIEDLAPPPSRALALAELVHASASPLALLHDAIVVAGVALCLGSSAMGALGMLAFLPVAALTGLYDRRSTLETQGVAWYLRPLATALVPVAAGLVMFQPGSGDRSQLLTMIAATFVALAASRALLWVWIASARRRGHGLRPTLVSGPAPAVAQVLRRIRTFPESGLRATAVHTPAERPDQRNPERRLAPPDGRRHKRALDLIDSRQVDVVLLVAAGGDCGTYDELVHRGDGSGIEFDVVIPFTRFATSHARARLGDLGVVPLGQVNYRARTMPGKRVFDVVVSAVALLVLAPFLAAVALAIKLSDRGPVFYPQRRVGKNGIPFRIWKFRSMVVGADAFLEEHRHANVTDGLLFRVESDPRITRIGALLRRLSIDELPQLFNVLKGDMSFVGPRPLAVDPDDFDEVATKRHAVRPGITGPWQVHGGNALSYDDMVSIDLGYISGWSFRKDLWLLLRTVPVLLIPRSPV